MDFIDHVPLWEGGCLIGGFENVAGIAQLIASQIVNPEALTLSLSSYAETVYR